MNNKPIHLFAKWQIKAGHLETVLTLLAEMVKKSREEPGNLFYRLHQSTSDDHTLVLFEGYENEAAVAAHRNSEYFQTLVIGKIVPMLENREVVLTKELDFS